jgi:hypothetical protein
LGKNYLVNAPKRKVVSSVRYSPRGLSGFYAVSVRYPAAEANSSAVPVTIVDGRGSETVLLNQKIKGGVWRHLGVFRFAAQGPGYVEISNVGATGQVVADAVKFTPVEAPLSL